MRRRDAERVERLEDADSLTGLEERLEIPIGNEADSSTDLAIGKGGCCSSIGSTISECIADASKSVDGMTTGKTPVVGRSSLRGKLRIAYSLGESEPITFRSSSAISSAVK